MSEITGRWLSKTNPLATLTFVVLQCMDLLTTLLALSRGGVELNPVVRSLIPAASPVLGVVASKAILMTLAFPLSRRRRALLFGNVFYVVVVVWNIGMLRALR